MFVVRCLSIMITLTWHYELWLLSNSIYLHSHVAFAGLWHMYRYMYPNLTLRALTSVKLDSPPLSCCVWRSLAHALSRSSLMSTLLHRSTTSNGDTKYGAHEFIVPIARMTHQTSIAQIIVHLVLCIHLDYFVYNFTTLGPERNMVIYEHIK